MVVSCVWVWDLNSSFLEEQSVALTAEPSLQLLAILLCLGNFKLVDVQYCLHS